MSRELRDLGATVTLHPARRGRRLLVLVVAVLLLAAAGAWAGGEGDPTPSTTAVLAATVRDAPPAPPAPVAPLAESARAPEAAPLPVLGRVGDLLVHVPGEDPVLVSYHEASFAEALRITPLGDLLGNDNPTRSLTAEPHPDGLPFHVQVSRGRANAPTSAVDVVLPHDAPVRAPVAGTVTEVRPYQLYGAHDDVRLELQPDDSDRLVVLIHIEDVAVRAGDRVEVGDVLAGRARLFSFGAVVDRQTEPERYGHVHMEVKAPAATGDEVTAPE